MNALAEFFTHDAGQRRRAWLDAQSARAANALNYYLGPAAQPVNALASALEFTDAGDVTAAADASRNLWNNPSLSSAIDYTTAGVALALPLYSQRLGAGIMDVADDLVRGYDPNRLNAITAYHGSPHDFDKFDVGETPNGYHFFSNDKGYSEGLAGRVNLSRMNDGNMYDVDLDVNNPLVVDVPDAAKRELADAGIDISDLSPQEIEKAWIGGKNFESVVDFYEGDMRSGAHDGIVFKNTYDGFNRPTDQIVVFDDNLISIVRKYGIAGAALALGVSAGDVQAAMDREQ